MFIISDLCKNTKRVIPFELVDLIVAYALKEEIHLMNKTQSSRSQCSHWKIDLYDILRQSQIDDGK